MRSVAPGTRDADAGASPRTEGGVMADGEDPTGINILESDCPTGVGTV
ncbi:MAG: hypothetical protein WCG22_03970 [Lentisphaerota bacterium]|jgi:hypothetical protein